MSIFQWPVKIFLIFLLVSISRADEKSLYGPGDNVLELDVSNFDSTVYNSVSASKAGNFLGYSFLFFDLAPLCLILPNLLKIRWN